MRDTEPKKGRKRDTEPKKGRKRDTEPKKGRKRDKQTKRGNQGVPRHEDVTPANVTAGGTRRPSCAC